VAQIRISRVIDPKDKPDCDLLQISDYELEEVRLPASAGRAERKAIHVIVKGRNLKAVAQPLFVFVGDELLQFMRYPGGDARVEGVLLNEPVEGAWVEVRLGDQDAARHPRPVERARVKRLAVP
jgi:hypothetical protein